MQTHNLGYPRMGNHRELKKANEAYWAGKIASHELEQTAHSIRQFNWQLQQNAGIDWIPCNDFSFYDHVLDTSLMVGAIPDRFHTLLEEKKVNTLDLLFAMARGFQKDEYDITAMEMTKWFDTNYHYIVPEFKANQKFSFFYNKVIKEFAEAKRLGLQSKPVLLGPISFLLLGKEKESGFHRISLIDNLLPVYFEVLKQLDEQGAYFVQFDEPCLSLNLTDAERSIFEKTYNRIQSKFPNLNIILANYFECYGENLQTVLKLPVHTLHLDLVRCPLQLDDILATGFIKTKTCLSLGLVDGRNIWINDFEKSLSLINKAAEKIGKDRIWIAPSCSLLHSPGDLDMETKLDPEIKQWLAFAKQKLDEVVALKQLANEENIDTENLQLIENIRANESRKTSSLIHNPEVKRRVAAISPFDYERAGRFDARKEKQHAALHLPEFPTTTIGSFPQT
ncbi:MAG TPA: 5-methyltetrahydropteroyltriglutamate--homocysteine S-methyltransferase, partial [Hanamia sp.]